MRRQPNEVWVCDLTLTGQHPPSGILGSWHCMALYTYEGQGVLTPVT